MRTFLPLGVHTWEPSTTIAHSPHSPYTSTCNPLVHTTPHLDHSSIEASPMACHFWLKGCGAVFEGCRCSTLVIWMTRSFFQQPQKKLDMQLLLHQNLPELHIPKQNDGITKGRRVVYHLSPGFILNTLNINAPKNATFWVWMNSENSRSFPAAGIVLGHQNRDQLNWVPSGCGPAPANHEFWTCGLSSAWNRVA